MTWQSTPWADPLLLSAVVSASLAVFGLLYVSVLRRDRRVVAFAVLMVATAVWTLGYSFQFASADLATKVRWAAVATVGKAVVPVAWFTFAAAYARRTEWLRPARLGVLWTVPLVTVVLAATNGRHGLVWTSTRIVTATDGQYLALSRSAGPWLYAHGVVSYVVVLAGVVFLVGLIARSRHVYRGQAVVLFVGIAVPAVANLAVLSDAGPGAAVDLTAPSLAVLGGAFAVAIFRYRLFDLVPVARSAVIENMGEGYVLLDDDGTVVDFNAAARSLLDGADGRLVGRPANAAFGTDMSVLDEFDGTPTTATTSPTSTADGSEGRYLELTVSAVEAEGVTGRLVAVRDVTDRIQVERRFQTLIEASSDIVLVLDEAGVIEYASPSVNRILGYEPSDLVDEVAFDALTVDEPDEPGTTGTDESTDGTVAVDDDAGDATERSTAVETWYRMLEGHDTDPTETTTNRFEVDVRTASGSERTIDVIARYLVEDPAVEGIVVNARDVTERKRRELELERTNERLDRFASLVSHDLRNPLQVANGHLDMAARSGDTEHLETVREQHERMNEMIDDLLSMAHEGATVEAPTPVAVATAAREAWANVETRDAALVVESDATVVADESRLSTLFENLFRNAVEHGPAEADDARELTVTVADRPDGFVVRDDGVGIPTDQRERILEYGHTTSRGNTGLGLGLVTEVTRAHGWEVHVGESERGGASFAFVGVEFADEPRVEAGDPDGTYTGEVG